MGTALAGGPGKLPRGVHESHDWVIAEMAPDFRLLDAWALPVEGTAEDRDAALELLEAFDPFLTGSATSRALFRLRERLGAWLGWDDSKTQLSIPGCEETTLSVRLPTKLRGSAAGGIISKALARVGGRFVPLYKTGDEWAAEISNKTVHGVLQLAWVEEGAGRYRARLAIYVKPRGTLGSAYLKLIEPFRLLVVYPALMREMERAWEHRTRQ